MVSSHDKSYDILPFMLSIPLINLVLLFYLTRLTILYADTRSFDNLEFWETLVIESTGEKNDIGINVLNIYIIKTRFTVGMNGLGINGSSLCYKEAIEKRLTVDNDSIKTTALKISGLGVTGSSLRYERAMKERSTIDNNSVRTIGFGMSGLGEISSNLHYDRHPRHCWSTSKCSPACFDIKSFILLWQYYILFLLKISSIFISRY